MVVSPNPSSSEIFVDRSTDSTDSNDIFDGSLKGQRITYGQKEFITTELYDSGGTLVRRQEFNFSVLRPSIDVSDLRKGNYFLKIIGKEIDEVHQIVVN